MSEKQKNFKFQEKPKMKTKTLLFYLLAALLGGCVPIFSLHPLYTEKEVVFKQDLVGAWADPNEPGGTWKFTRNTESENAYILTLDADEGIKGLFDAHLVNLKGELYLDLFPSEKGFEELMESLEEAAKDPNNNVWAFNLFATVPVHTFVKVDLSESTLSLRLTDDELMKKILEKDPKAIKHVLLDSDRYILTATTQELQAFVNKYGDADLFEDPMVLKRAKAEKPKKKGDAADK
jgi:hypothetical protein